jgi:putative ABC transport system permease protein
MHTGGSDWKKYWRRKELSETDAEAIKRSCPSVKAASPLAQAQTRVSFEKEMANHVNVVGSDPNYNEMGGQLVDEGRSLTENDVATSRNVCVLGRAVADKLFPFSDPLGQQVRIEGRKLEVIGLLERKGNVMGQSKDNIILLPYPVFKQIWGNGWGTSLMIMARSPELYVRALDEVVSTLRRVRGVKWDEDNDFEIVTQASLLEGFKKITGGVFIVMIAIAAISLLVGGIGIMNIMYVSVTERTKEIGIRKALGARRNDILGQFLTEAVILSGLGGLIGVLLGLGLALAVKSFTPLPVHTPLWTILLALGFSSLVGLFFGIYPALHAARLDPIESLRYE